MIILFNRKACLWEQELGENAQLRRYLFIHYLYVFSGFFANVKLLLEVITSLVRAREETTTWTLELSY